MLSEQYEHGASAAIFQHSQFDLLDDQINLDEANRKKMREGAQAVRKYRVGNTLYFPEAAWGIGTLKAHKPKTIKSHPAFTSTL